MGSVKQWIEVALAAGFWVGLKLLLDMMRDHLFRQSTRTDLFPTIVAGFWFGFLMTFGWQAIHRPLLYFVITAFVATAVAAILYRQKLRSSTASG